jgi:hypothetical protein
MCLAHVRKARMSIKVKESLCLVALNQVQCRSMKECGYSPILLNSGLHGGKRVASGSHLLSPFGKAIGSH